MASGIEATRSASTSVMVITAKQQKLTKTGRCKLVRANHYSLPVVYMSANSQVSYARSKIFTCDFIPTWSGARCMLESLEVVPEHVAFYARLATTRRMRRCMPRLHYCVAVVLCDCGTPQAAKSCFTLEFKSCRSRRPPKLRPMSVLSHASLLPLLRCTEHRSAPDVNVSLLPKFQTLGSVQS
eukprot:6451279-Amphidinium_carterae.1